MTRRLVLTLIGGALSISCGQALLTAPIGSTLAIFINPPFISANGDIAVVSVFVLEPAGTPVPDGTVVQFFTNLGKIQEQGKTNDGVARVNFESDARSGTARITVFSGPATGTSEVAVGSSRPARIFLGTVDPRIDLKIGQSIADFKVTLVDASGNPVAGVPVRFSVVDNPATDTVHTITATTDNNGDAFSRVQTRRTTAGTIKVRAQALIGGPDLAVEIPITVVQ